MILILIKFVNKMNTILLTIWIKILFFTAICVYYNKKILDKFLEANISIQPTTNPLCQYEDIPTLDKSSLAICKTIGNTKTYIYSAAGVNYEIAGTQAYYTKVCSGFCISGLSSTGDCKVGAEQTNLESCETLLQPKTGCISSSKPLVNVTDTSGTTQYYYAVAPINSLNSCS